MNQHETEKKEFLSYKNYKIKSTQQFTIHTILLIVSGIEVAIKSFFLKLFIQLVISSNYVLI